MASPPEADRDTVTSADATGALLLNITPRLRRYLAVAFPTLRDPEDVIQDVFLEFLRARAAPATTSAVYGLFGAVRHRALRTLRDRRRCRHRELLCQRGALGNDPIAKASHRERLQRMQRARDLLPR